MPSLRGILQEEVVKVLTGICRGIQIGFSTFKEMEEEKKKGAKVAKTKKELEEMKKKSEDNIKASMLQAQKEIEEEK